MRELDQMTAWLPQDREIPDASAEIYWAFDQIATLTSKVGN